MPDTPLPPSKPEDDPCPLTPEELRKYNLIPIPLEPEPIRPIWEIWKDSGSFPSLKQAPKNPQPPLKPLNPLPAETPSNGTPVPAPASSQPVHEIMESSLPPPCPEKRSRGAQPGNLNALKHGLYIDGTRIKNTTPLERARLFDLNDLIDDIKSYMRFTYENGIRSRNMAEINETMRSLSLAAMSLTRLISTHNDFIATPLPHDLQVNRRTNVVSLINHLKKKLEPYADLCEIDTRPIEDPQ